MVDFTSTNPTKNSFRTGTNINQPFNPGIIAPSNPEVGKGTLVTFVSNQIIANGTYDFLGQSGTFSLTVLPEGNEFHFSLNITGSAQSYSRDFVGPASQVNATTVTLQQQNGNLAVTFSQNNGSFFTDGKIEISANWTPITLYIDSNV